MCEKDQTFSASNMHFWVILSITPPFNTYVARYPGKVFMVLHCHIQYAPEVS